MHVYKWVWKLCIHLIQVEEAERAYWAKYQRQMSEQEVTFPKPFFVRPLQANFSLNENQVCWLLYSI